MPEKNNNITRRQFVAGSAAAAVAAPMMLTGRSWVHAAANEKINVLAIGTGRRSYPLMSQFFKDSRFRIVGVAEVDTNRRKHAKDRVDKAYASKDCKAVNDYRDLLDHKDIDCALIMTPDHWHTIPAMQAALMGKHVYAEKPLTLNIRESQMIIAAQKKKGITFQTGSQQRSEMRGVFSKACSYVRSGRLGKCELAEASSGDPSVPCNLPTEKPDAGLDWDLWQGAAPARGYNAILCPRGVHKHFPKFRLYEEYAGGILADWGAHMFDIAQWGFDKDRESPVKVIPPKDPKAKRGTKLVYADGKTIIHSGGSFKCKFIGEKGSITVSRGKISSEPASILKEPLTDKDTILPDHKNHVKNFGDCIGTKNQPVCDVEVGARTATLCHLANIAYDLKHPLDFDGKNWKFKNNGAANKRLDYGERRKGFELPKV